MIDYMVAYKLWIGGAIQKLLKDKEDRQSQFDCWRRMNENRFKQINGTKKETRPDKKRICRNSR